MAKNLLIYAALNGSRYSKVPSKDAPQGVPWLPCTIEECIKDVKDCYNAGVRLVHMHSRTSSGEHRADAKWYQTVALMLKESWPDLRFCFATSRAGAVAGQIYDKYALLRKFKSEKEARVESECVRLACLDAALDEQLPHFITAFTATEVRMEDVAADIGHVQDAQNPEIIQSFFKRALEVSKNKNVRHELEITTNESIEILEKLQKYLCFSSPLSIVILPGFTEDFPFSHTALDSIVPRARKVIENSGGGLLTLGRVIAPTKSTESGRFECIEYALGHPDIDAIRVGIEDAPYWDCRPSTNLELITNTINYVSRLNGSIVTKTNSRVVV